MTYKIWYKEHKMFDIDIYVACTEKAVDGNRRYYTEVKPSIVADGLGHYIIDNIKTPEELEELLQWVNEVDDMRTTLWEGGPRSGPEWENSCVNCHDADMRMCKIHKPVFEDTMRKFCEKYNLSLITD